VKISCGTLLKRKPELENNKYQFVVSWKFARAIGATLSENLSNFVKHWSRFVADIFSAPC